VVGRRRTWLGSVPAAAGRAAASDTRDPGCRGGVVCCRGSSGRSLSPARPPGCSSSSRARAWSTPTRSSSSPLPTRRTGRPGDGTCASQLPGNPCTLRDCQRRRADAEQGERPRQRRDGRRRRPLRRRRHARR